MVFEVKIVARLEQYALKEVLVPVESLDITIRTRNMKQASRWYKNGWFALSCNQFQIWKSVHQEQEENKSCFHNRGSTMVTVYCACHLIKMSYLLVQVVPCYQFKLGWRICNINRSYYFVFRFLSPGVQSFDPFLCCLCCRRFRSDSLQEPSRWEKGKEANRYILMYVLLFEFHSRDGVSAFSALVTWKARELLVLILKCC